MHILCIIYLNIKSDTCQYGGHNYNPNFQGQSVYCVSWCLVAPYKFQTRIDIMYFFMFFLLYGSNVLCYRYINIRGMINHETCVIHHIICVMQILFYVWTCA
jgi:hypothetical protein